MGSVRTRQRNARGEGARLRVEIVEATIRLIDERVDRLSLSAIAREAGIAQPSIYDHFPGVDSIRTEVIRRCYDDLIERISQAQRGVEDPVERLDVTCVAYLEYGAEFPHRYALLFQAERDQAEKRAVGDRGAAALQTLVDGIDACKTASRSTSADPYHDGVAVWSAIHGLTTLRASRPHFPQLHSEEMLRDIVHRLARIGAPK
jgi:AcrR family transcriptional regulator